MYQNMIISIGIYSINRPEAGYGWGVAYIYVYTHEVEAKRHDFGMKMLKYSLPQHLPDQALGGKLEKVCEEHAVRIPLVC